MVNPFAAIEDSLNRASSAALANAEAQWQGVCCLGIFSAIYRDALGMVSSAPRFTCLDNDLDAMAPGDTLTVTYRGLSTAYLVREIQPDSTGMTTLILESA